MVLGKALLHATPNGRAAIVHAVLGDRGLIAAMAQTRHGHLAVQLILSSADRLGAREAELQLLEVLMELQVPAEQQLATELPLLLLLQEELAEDKEAEEAELELEEAGLSRLRSLMLGLATPSLP